MYILTHARTFEEEHTEYESPIAVSENVEALKSYASTEGYDLPFTWEDVSIYGTVCWQTQVIEDPNTQVGHRYYISEIKVV